ncbi:hypothetical protein [Egicoccus halophilus]|uniref:Uncharacterized protein n=1 Tax=Egicoccus halophilus TaxID=1670830 RepID=A0A8J3AA11_9ACTN|nr:hypothetical protein [Egicoccus halophilus]GGI08306.1 hypothetical protein GCM10011354_28430 [Egicoccus halophilus]
MRRLRPRTDPRLHPVDERGLVGCARVGVDVSVELCMACPALEGVERRDGQLVTIACRPPVSPTAAAGPFPWDRSTWT